MFTETPDNETCLKIIEEYINGKATDGRHFAKELADILGISEVTLSRWRNRKIQISAAYRRQIPFICRTADTALAINHSAASVHGDAIVNEGNANLDEIVSQIMESDMCPECKIKAYNIIKKKS